uniref:HAT C-terminal dimerisation domain-containing protein n=1 Tax=Fusarium oxysporum (strain Fo5176) TaxID=660025 RepID=A0A0C4DI06_FUSOF
MAAQQQSLESILGISGQRKSLKQQLDAASIKTEAGRTTLADLPTVQIGCKKYIPEEYIANKNRKGRRSWIQAHGFFLTEVSPDLRTLQTYWRRCLESPTARSNVNKAKELTVGWIVTANLPFTAPSNPYLRRMLDFTRCIISKRGTVESAVTLALTYGLLQTGMLSLASTPTISTPPIKSNRDSLLCAVYGDLIPETTKQRQYMISWASMGYEIGLARVSAITPHPMIHAWRASIVNYYPAMAEEDIRNHRTRCFGHILNLAARAFLWGEDPDSFEREAFTEAAFQVEERELRLWRKRGAVGKLHNIVRFVRASPQGRELMKSLACDQNDEDGYQLFEEERAAIDLELMQNNETRWNSTFLMIQRAIRKREHIDHFIAYLETKTSEPRQRVPVQDQLSPQDWLLLAEIQSLLKPLHEITMRCQGWAKEGRHGALWEVMIGMEYLLNFFEEQNLIFSSPDSCISELRNFRVSATKRSSAQRIEQGRGREKHLPQHAREEYTDVVLQDENLDDDHRRCVQISIKNCWSKLDEYYSLLGQSPLYPAAVILHPRWNVSWLEANWTSDEQLVWLRDAKNSVREFFEQHYPREEQPETSRTVTGKAVRQDEPSQFDQWMQSCDRCMMEEEDELGVYMRQGPVRRENLNPVLWWKDHQEEYPRLSKFALDILAIPAMSVDPERTFSVTKLTSALIRAHWPPSKLQSTISPFK